MSPITTIVRDAQISAALNNLSTGVTMVEDYSSYLNSHAAFGKTGSHVMDENVNSLKKGIEFDKTTSISKEIIERYDNFTFKFKTPGVYRIDYHVTANIASNNTVATFHIRPSVSDTLINNGEFLNIQDFGIMTTLKTVQVSSNVDKISPHAIDSIYDSCTYRYNGNGDMYFKLLAWGPNTIESFIGADATLIFTYLSS